MTTKKTFPIVGMHCASCAKLIERKLSNTRGVKNAMVNYASEVASIEVDTDVQDQDLAKLVSDLGYKAVFAETVSGVIKGKTAEELKEEEKKKELKDLKIKVIISGILSAVIMIGSFGMLSPFILLILAIPVQFWAGWEFYLATWSGLK